MRYKRRTCLCVSNSRSDKRKEGHTMTDDTVYTDLLYEEREGVAYITMTHNGHTIFEAKDGAWAVGVRMANDTVAVTKGTDRFTSEATATLEALRQHAERPHMNFVAVRA